MVSFGYEENVLDDKVKVVFAIKCTCTRVSRCLHDLPSDKGVIM